MVSSKIFKILKNFYENTSLRIKTQNRLTEFVKINKGVLQSEISNPLLFFLFLSDFKAFFIEQGCSGVSLDNLHEVILQAYVDNLFIHADSQVNIRR